MSAVDVQKVARVAGRPASITGVHLSSFYDLTLRNMATRVTRTMLTALGIVIGVAVILAVDVTNATTLASIRNLFNETSGRASLLVEPSAASSAGFKESVLSAIQKVPEVEQAAPLVSVRTELATQRRPGELHFDTGTASLSLLGVDPAVDPYVHIYRLVEGRLLLPEDAGEHVALITTALADDLERSVGEKFEIITPDGPVALEIVGILDKEGLGRTNDGRVVIVPLETAQDLFSMRGQLSQVDVVVEQSIAEDPDRLEALKQRLADRLPREVSVSYPAARGKLISQMLKTYQLGLGFFGAVAIFVGGFLIYNTFSMTVLERTREIGMLRSIGATRRQIVFLFLAESVVLAAGGSLLGLVGGLGLARVLIRAMAELLGTELEFFTVPMFSLFKGLVVGVGVTVVSSLLPALQAGKISPLEAIRVYARAAQSFVWTRRVYAVGLVIFAGCYFVLQFDTLVPRPIRLQVGIVSVFGLLLGATLLVPLAFSWVKPPLRRVTVVVYGPEGLLGSRNVERVPTRTALTVAALMVGVTMVIALGEISNNFRHDIFAWVETAIGGDLYVRSSTPMRPELGQRLQSVPGVRALTPVTFTRVRLLEPDDDGDPDTIVAIAIDPDTYLDVASFKFADEQTDAAARVRELAEGDALFISTTLADRYGLKRGDSVVLETRRGRHAFRVAAVIVDFTAQGNTVTLSRRDLYRYFGERRVSTFTVDVDPNADPEAVRQAIEDRFGRRENITVESNSEFRARVTDLMNQSFALLNALVAIAVLVSSFGIINTLLMNVFERTREIGMLRSLGATRRQITGMVLAESATMGLAGGVFGLLLGLLLAGFMVKGLNLAGGYRLVYRFTPVPVGTGLLIALLISQVAAVYPARRAARTNIVEAIKHE